MNYYAKQTQSNPISTPKFPCSILPEFVDYNSMPYVESILALFAIVDPVGNIPILLHVSEHTPEGQSQKAFNTAVVVGIIILLGFSFGGKSLTIGSSVYYRQFRASINLLYGQSRESIGGEDSGLAFNARLQYLL